jgi:CCR4-NOT transcription complex subunit 4
MEGGDEVCPLCCETLELIDRYFEPCPCGFTVCMFCWNRIRETGNGQCPACRHAYSDKPKFKDGYDPNE